MKENQKVPSLYYLHNTRYYFIKKTKHEPGWKCVTGSGDTCLSVITPGQLLDQLYVYDQKVTHTPVSGNAQSFSIHAVQHSARVSPLLCTLDYYVLETFPYKPHKTVWLLKSGFIAFHCIDFPQFTDCSLLKAPEFISGWLVLWASPQCTMFYL